jgi:uncharacterized protein (TIGR00290 family)
MSGGRVGSREKAVVFSSGGKDSALALFEAGEQCEVAALLTTVTTPDDRVVMHGVRRVLIAQQAAALGLPLEVIPVPPVCTNADYEARVRAALDRHCAAEVTAAVFGDVFLEDVRRYREERLLGGLRGVFPLWGRDSRELAGRFLDLGFRAVLCCVDTRVLDPSFAGRPYDRDLLDELPAGVDPCGENGEFHTFVHDGPGFARPVPFCLGECDLSDGRFARRDLLSERG